MTQITGAMSHIIPDWIADIFEYMPLYVICSLFILVLLWASPRKLTWWFNRKHIDNSIKSFQESEIGHLDEAKARKLAKNRQEHTDINKAQKILALIWDERACSKNRFDRALLIALVYPLGLLLLMWLLTGMSPIDRRLCLAAQ